MIPVIDTIAETELRAELLRRCELDQHARFACLDARDRGDDVDWAPVEAIDADNLGFLVAAIGQYGWLGSDLVGRDGAHACWLLVQHAPPDYQDQWLPLMKRAVADGRASASDLVYLQDRVNMHHQRYQTHGSQFFGSSEQPRLWPVSDPATVNRPARRRRPASTRPGHHRRRMDARGAAPTRISLRREHHVTARLARRCP